MIKDRITEFIESEIKNRLDESKVLYIDISKLMIQVSDYDFGTVQLNELCEQIKSKGLYSKFVYFHSFIYRHIILVSKKQINERRFICDFENGKVVEQRFNSNDITGYENKKDAERHLKYITDFNKNWNKK